MKVHFCDADRACYDSRRVNVVLIAADMIYNSMKGLKAPSTAFRFRWAPKWKAIDT